MYRIGSLLIKDLAVHLKVIASAVPHPGTTK